MEMIFGFFLTSSTHTRAACIKCKRWIDFHSSHNCIASNRGTLSRTRMINKVEEWIWTAKEGEQEAERERKPPNISLCALQFCVGKRASEWIRGRISLRLFCIRADDHHRQQPSSTGWLAFLSKFVWKANITRPFCTVSNAYHFSDEFKHKHIKYHIENIGSKLWPGHATKCWTKYWKQKSYAHDFAYSHQIN